MSRADDRRYTDQEVALVLKRASELEERRGRSGGAGGGLTLEQLADIAREVGLDPQLVTEAALELDTRRPAQGVTLLGPSATRKVVHAVSGQLDQEGLRALIEVVDHEVAADGLVTEALGQVRWTGENRIVSTQVSFAPAGDETRIQVTQRYRPQVRVALQAVPGVWGAIGAMGVAAGAGLLGLPLAAAVVGGAVLGAGVGRAVWHGLSAASGRSVRSLGTRLAAGARQVAAQAEPTALSSAGESPGEPGEVG